ncbi:MAG: DUF1576 domain-containing protein [Clostridiales bacterium]|nr:DUF1576 domain-containing protein [Clostridiales bacterium]
MQNNKRKPAVKHYPGAPIHKLGGPGQWRDDISGDHPQMAALLQRYYYEFFGLLGILFIGLAFVFDPPGQIVSGMLTILTSPANLLTDYIQLAGAGATLCNVGLITLLSIGITRLNRLPVSGSIVAGIFTMIGFSFFGKNLYNTIPIILGVFLYARVIGQPFGEYVLHSMFGTALSPLVSAFSFSLGLSTPVGVALGVASGLLVGFVIVPLSLRFLHFHRGYSLYNIGFTAGIIGMFFTAALRGFGVEVQAVSILSEGRNLPFSLMLVVIFLALLLIGLRVNHWRLKGYRRLFSLPGVLPTDFLALRGFGVSLINMSLLGMLSVGYVLALGGELNGPVIGGIFTVVGFGAYGKHLKNVLPILVGVTLVNIFNIHDASATFTIIAALFGTTLAPIAGRYGVLAGIVAGFLHMSLVTNVGFLHAGMNLYNNGFSGGFVAALLCPMLDTIEQIRQMRRR